MTLEEKLDEVANFIEGHKQGEISLEAVMATVFELVEIYNCNHPGVFRGSTCPKCGEYVT